MHRFVALALLAACGRVGFDPRNVPAGGARDAGGDGGGSGSGTGDAGGGGDGAATCAYLTTCALPKVTCCVGTTSMCTTTAGCSTGTILVCNPDPPYDGCTTNQACCPNGDAGLACFDPPVPC